MSEQPILETGTVTSDNRGKQLYIPDDILAIIAKQKGLLTKNDGDGEVNITQWQSGVYRKGTVVQHNIGQFYLSERDTAEEPFMGAKDWKRLGSSGFRFANEYQMGKRYYNQDLYTKDGNLFLFLEGKEHLIIKAGPQGDQGEPGVDGKDGQDGRDGVDGHGLKSIELDGTNLIFITSNPDGTDSDSKIVDLIDMIDPLAKKYSAIKKSTVDTIKMELPEFMRDFIEKELLTNQSDPVAVPIRFFRGNWDSSSTYEPGDVIKYGGGMLVCTETSSGTPPDSATGGSGFSLMGGQMPSTAIDDAIAAGGGGGGGASGSISASDFAAGVLLTDGSLSTASNTKIATSLAAKTYADNSIGQILYSAGSSVPAGAEMTVLIGTVPYIFKNPTSAAISVPATPSLANMKTAGFITPTISVDSASTNKFFPKKGDSIAASNQFWIDCGATDGMLLFLNDTAAAIAIPANITKTGLETAGFTNITPAVPAKLQSNFFPSAGDTITSGSEFVIDCGTDGVLYFKNIKTTSIVIPSAPLTLEKMQTAGFANPTPKKDAQVVGLVNSDVSSSPANSTGFARRTLLMVGNSIAGQNSAVLPSGGATIATEVRGGQLSVTLNAGGVAALGLVVNDYILLGLCMQSFFVSQVTNITSETVTFADRLPSVVRAGAFAQKTTSPNFWPTVNSYRGGLGHISIANALLGAPLHVLHGYGYGGAISGEIEADLPFLLAATKPDFVYFVMYENDLNTTFRVPSAQVIARTKRMVKMVIDSGGTPFVELPLPINSYDATQAASYDAVVNFLLTMPETIPGSYYIDHKSLYIDTTSDATKPRKPLPGWATDGTHPDAGKRLAIAQYNIDKLKAIIGSRTETGSLLNGPNVYLTGTGGTASGLQGGSVVPASTSITAQAGVTCTTSKNASDQLVIDMAITGASNVSSTQLTISQTYTVPKTYSPRTMLKAMIRLNVQSMKLISYPQLTLACGGITTTTQGDGDFTKNDFLTNQIITFETIAIPYKDPTATTAVITFAFRPLTLVSPANVEVKCVVEEMGLEVTSGQMPVWKYGV